MLKEVGKKQFKDIDLASLFPNPNIFCHFASGLDAQVYSPVTSFESLRSILEDGLSGHNEVNATMDLVLFEDAMSHVCRIARSMEIGHSLLVGVGGSGKQSLSRYRRPRPPPPAVRQARAHAHACSTHVRTYAPARPFACYLQRLVLHLHPVRLSFSQAGSLSPTGALR
jgi:hypothetical protein